MNHHVRSWVVVAGLALLTAPAAVGVAPQELTLENGQLRAVFTDGRLASIVDVRTGDTVRFSGEQAGVTVNGAPTDLSGITPSVTGGRDRLEAAYATADVAVTVEYELRPGWGFLSKRLRIVPRSAGAYRVNEIRT